MLKYMLDTKPENSIALPICARKTGASRLLSLRGTEEVKVSRPKLRAAANPYGESVSL